MTPAQVAVLLGHAQSTPGSEPVESLESVLPAFEELLRRDWALRVLTTWAKLFVGSWGFAADDSCHLQSEDHGWREFKAATEDETYLAAARAAFDQLPPDAATRLGVEP